MELEHVTLSVQSQKEIGSRAALGDPDAVEQIVKSLVHLFKRYSKNEDEFHEIICAFLRALPKYDGTHAMSTFATAYGILPGRTKYQHSMKMFGGMLSRQKEKGFRCFSLEVCHDGYTADACRLDNQDELEFIYGRIDRLSPRNALLLKDRLDGYTYSKLSAKYKISKQRAQQLVKRDLQFVLQPFNTSVRRKR